MEEEDVVAVSWRLALSGRGGRIAACPKRTTLGQLATSLGLGEIRVVVGESVFGGHADAPFLEVASAEVDVDAVVLSGSWPNAARALRWKRVELSSEAEHGRLCGLLRALVALEEEGSDEDGVRAATRIEVEAHYVVDDAFVFAKLSRAYDVWFTYLGNLTVDGIATEPRSAWLHGDVFTPLQPVAVGDDFTLPAVAAAYTQAHLRFELEPGIASKATAPLRLAFDVAVGMARSESRRVLARQDHVSQQGWALADGAVAWSSAKPAFLRARLRVLRRDDVQDLPPYEYALDEPERPGDVHVDFSGLEGREFVREGAWHRAADVYRGLAVSRRAVEPRPPFEPWSFLLRTRRLARDGGGGDAATS